MILGHTLNGDSMVVVTTAKSYSIKQGCHAKYDEIRNALADSDYDTALPLLDQVTVIREFADGKLVVNGNEVFYNERPLHGAIIGQLLRLIEEDFSVTHLTAFLDNLFQNPSRVAVEELYDFINTCNLTITPDGHFLAYKFVTKDYKDCHTETIDNSIGAKPEMPRNEVDDDRRNHCSEGLHFCSKDYLLGGWGERWMIVKINPADVVSIPNDYNFNKGRCWTYEVVGEIENELLDEAAADEALDSAVDTKWTNAARAGRADAMEDDAKRIRQKKSYAKMRNPRPEYHGFEDGSEEYEQYMDAYTATYD